MGRELENVLFWREEGFYTMMYRGGVEDDKGRREGNDMVLIKERGVGIRLQELVETIE